MPNPDILAERYATPELKELFSEESRILLERDLWILVMQAQFFSGRASMINEDDIKKYEAAKANINLQRIREIELRTKHDIKAKIEAFVEAAGMQGKGEILHKGMTSRDLSDNVDQFIIARASQLLFERYLSLLKKFASKAEEYRDTIIVARTHHQAAQPTTLGRRFSMWAEELYHHLSSFEYFRQNYPLRGIKGPVGTQADMINFFKDRNKLREFELFIAQLNNLSKVLDATGQIYPRSFDYDLVSRLVLLASPCSNFATTLRLMAGEGIASEGFSEGQTGSSAMPHKMNARSCERINSLTELLKGYATAASNLAGNQWYEGDVSCSALRREVIPSAFYVADGICETALHVLKNMKIYPRMIKAELDMYAPFLASSSLLAEATNSGLGREQAHEIIKRCSIAEYTSILSGESDGESSREPDETGSTGSDEKSYEKGHKKGFAEKLSSEPAFAEKEITTEHINEIIEKTKNYVGLAKEQTDAVVEKCRKFINSYHADFSNYEAREIL